MDFIARARLSFGARLAWTRRDCLQSLPGRMFDGGRLRTIGGKAVNQWKLLRTVLLGTVLAGL
ncbi:MAG TPA: hypothetical protein VGG45_00255, partial [Terracidiphilus sp.]